MAIASSTTHLKNTLFAIIILLFFFLLLESAARIFYPQVSGVSDRIELAKANNPDQARQKFGRLFQGCVLSYNTMSKDKKGLMLNRPGSNGVMLRAAQTNYVYDLKLDQERLENLRDTIEEKTFFTINSNGLRGPEIVNDERKRLLLLGDSITFGYYVNDDEVYGARLQKNLGAQYQVLNAGVSSYSAADHLRYLEEYGLKKNPDLVGVGFYLNDIFSLAKPLMVKEYNFFFPYRKLPSLGILNKSRLVNLVIERIFTLDAFANLTIDENRAENISVEYAWQNYRSILSKMKELSEQKNFKLFVIIFPNAIQFKRPLTRKYYQERLLQITGELKIPTLDLYRPFAKYGADLYNKNDTIHPNATGHELTAVHLTTFLRTNNLL